MSAEERRIPDSLGRLHDDIINRYDRIRSARDEEHLLGSLPETCQAGCTIAKMVIEQLMKEGFKSDLARERLGECPGSPRVVGECSIKKTVCSHPESGGSDNFHAQIDGLHSYIQSERA